jgi:hypothetical protein
MMSRKAWKLAVVILAGCVLATASAACIDGEIGNPAQAAAHPASAEEVCSDERVGKTFGGDTSGCHEYLDACLSELTDSQRAEWRRSVNTCLERDGALYSCYAEVPWC